MFGIPNLIDDLDTEGLIKITSQRNGPKDDSQRYDALAAAKTAIEIAHELIRWATRGTDHERSAEGYVLGWLADIHGDMAGATGHHAVTVADLEGRFDPSKHEGHSDEDDEDDDEADAPFDREDDDCEDEADAPLE